MSIAMREHRTRQTARSKEVSPAGCLLPLRLCRVRIEALIGSSGCKRADYLWSSLVTSEVLESLTHSCPHCHAVLALPSGAWDGWVRCRACGRVFLPPEYETLSHADGGSGDSSPPLEIDSQSDPTGLRAVQPLSGRMAHTSPARVVFTTGFVLCLLLTLIYFLDFSPGPMAIFGFLTIGFFLLLLRTPRKRRPPAGATWVRTQLEATSNDDANSMSNS